jgi:hypothetical protein
MGAPGRVELPTNGLGNRCSIHLSYGATDVGSLSHMDLRNNLCDWHCIRFSRYPQIPALGVSRNFVPRPLHSRH